MTENNMEEATIEETTIEEATIEEATIEETTIEEATIETLANDSEWHKTISFKDFYADYCDMNTKKNIKQACIVLYICSGITLAMYLLVASALMTGAIDTSSASWGSVATSIISVLTLIVLSIFVHTKQSRVCASLILAYALGTFFYSLATTGKPGGLLVLIGAVYAFRYTFSAHKEHKNFKN